MIALKTASVKTPYDEYLNWAVVKNYPVVVAVMPYFLEAIVYLQGEKYGRHFNTINNYTIVNIDKFGKFGIVYGVAGSASHGREG